MMEFRHEHRNLVRDVVETEITYTFEESNLDDVMQAFRSFLLAVGYSPVGISEYIEEP